MKLFITKALLFLIIVISIISITLIFFGGYVDYFYEKFTTPKASSLILGDSRSMQGIQPSVINTYFQKEQIAKPIMNYSFTIAQISYGPSYTASIKKKLNRNTSNGLFIVTVNPWVLSSRENDDEEKGVFFETNLPPNNMKFVNANPNFEYFIKNFNYFHFKSIIRRSSKMHKDGWLEESNLPKDTIMLNSWKKKQLILYEDFASRWKKSDYRMKRLFDLVIFLNTYGHVVLVRMPIDAKLLELENSYWPQFDDEINRIAIDNHIKYFDFSKSSDIYQTYDGNHLDKFGGKIFTKHLCDSIHYNKNNLYKTN